VGYNSVFKPGLFKGQTVVVTGGGSGIGRCTAHELASLGAFVVLVGRKQDKLDKVAAEIREDGGECSTVAFDIRDEDAVKAGMVMVNLPTAGVDYHVPFGGSKKSSYGAREQGFSAVEFYTQTKTAYSWA